MGGELYRNPYIFILDLALDTNAENNLIPSPSWKYESLLGRSGRDRMVVRFTITYRKKIPIRKKYVSCHDDINLNGHNMSLSYCIISRTLQLVVIRIWIWICCVTPLLTIFRTQTQRIIWYPLLTVHMNSLKIRITTGPFWSWSNGS
jgi:hypothetical protein